MAWLLWLLTPVLMTVLGMFVMLLRGAHGSTRSRLSDPQSEHEQLLEALARAHPPILTPLNAVVSGTEPAPNLDS